MAGDSSIGLRSQFSESASCKAGPRRASSRSEAPMTLPVFVGIDVAKATLEVGDRRL
jgi:hypothetical protein